MPSSKSTFVLAVLAATAVHATAARSSEQILRADVVRTLNDTEKKLVGLAEATPEDKFAYRPAEGVRSTAEVFMHTAGANYFLATFLGAKAPEGLSLDFDKSATEKAKVIEALKKSFEHARNAVEKLADAEMTKPIKMFGRDASVQSALLVLSNHIHEHLGQAIAYARANGIVPPWSKGKEG